MVDSNLGLLLVSKVMGAIFATFWLFYVNLVSWTNSPMPLPTALRESRSPPWATGKDSQAASSAVPGAGRTLRNKPVLQQMHGLSTGAVLHHHHAGLDGVELVFGGAGTTCVYQMGVVNAIRNCLDPRFLSAVRISGMSAGVAAALFTVAFPRAKVSDADFFGKVCTFSEEAAASGPLGLAQGIYDCLLHKFFPALQPEVRQRITSRVGVFVHNVDTGNVCVFRNLQCGEELARAAAASATVLLFTSRHSHVELSEGGGRFNDPAMYTRRAAYKCFAKEGRNVLYLIMRAPSPEWAPPVSTDSGSPSFSSIAPIHCMSPADVRWLPRLRLPTVEEKRSDFDAGEAWGRSYVVPRIKERLAAWGVAG